MGRPIVTNGAFATRLFSNYFEDLFDLLSDCRITEKSPDLSNSCGVSSVAFNKAQVLPDFCSNSRKCRVVVLLTAFVNSSFLSAVRISPLPP